MDIKKSLRENLIMYDYVNSNQVLDENVYTQLGGKVNTFIEERAKKIVAKILKNKKIVQRLAKNLEQAYRDIKDGKTDKKNENYDEVAYLNLKNSVYNLLKVLGVSAMFLIPFGGMSSQALIKILT